MVNRQRNFVILNGKKYSADTGKMIDTPQAAKNISGIKPAPKRTNVATDKPGSSKVASLTVARSIDQFKSMPQQIDRHPNHTDLSKVEDSPRKVGRPANPLSHKADIATTKMRPKSLKVQQPATGVHAKTTSASSTDRVKKQNFPQVSKVVASNSSNRTQVTNPRIDLGTEQQHARRLRAAQYRKNNQISKFAQSRRLVEQSDPQSKDIVSTKNNSIAVSSTETVAVRQETLAKPASNQFLPIAQPNQKLSAYLENQEKIKASEPQKTKKTKRQKERFSLKQNFASAAAASLSVLLIVGYVTYLNIPNFAMKVAASRAGFDASMPGYTPDGFSFHGPVAYNSGKVVVDFTSNSDDSSYQVAQQESSWDSKSLLENVVKEKSDKYLTFEDKGLTIYVYDGQNATWVNGGVMYSINSQSKLNTEQLINIATSI